MTRKLRLLALAVVALATGACFPRGEPPAGEQILEDPTASLLGLVPDRGDGVLRVLFFRPGKDAENVDLWVLGVDPNGGPSSERLLIGDISYYLQLSYRPTAESTSFPMDSKGRLYLNTVRCDPVTGETVPLGGEVSSLSKSRQRVLVRRDGGGYLLYEADDSTTVIDVASDLSSSYPPEFLDETLFYRTAEGELWSLAPGGAPRQLATGVTNYIPWDERVVLLMRADPDPSMPDPGTGFAPPEHVTAALLDTTTLAETPLPDGPEYQYGVNISPDLRWVGVSEWTTEPRPGENLQPNFLLIDRLTGNVETLDGKFRNAFWRPGHDELWLNFYGTSASEIALYIKKPGEPAVMLPGLISSGFTEDGTYWLSSQSTPFEYKASSDLIGPADDPTAPRFPAVPNGSTLLQRWTLGDGRLLTQSVRHQSDGFEDFFAQVVDPRDGASLLFGERGYLSAVGKTRILGIFQVSYERGDLTTLDLATGQRQVLAPEFAMAAVTEPQGADRYPPGGRVVYQYRARFASPWDGLWVAPQR